MLSGPSFRSAFVFSINPLIFCSFSWSLTIRSPSSWLYTLACAVVQKYLLWLFRLLVLILQSTCFICTTWKREQTTEQQSHRAYEQTKSKQKQNYVTSHSTWPCVLLLDLAHRQCSGIIKGWLHCLTSESNARFLVNNILFFGSAWSGHGANPVFFNKKNKDWTFKTLTNSSPLYVR